MMIVRDTHGVPLFRMEGNVLRDSAGKVIGEREGSDDEARSLSKRAARLMSERKVLLDLAPGDVVTPSTQAVQPLPFGDFVADQVSQVLYAPHDRGYWYVENATDAIKLVNAQVGGTGQPSEVEPSFKSTAFTSVPYALAARLPRHIVANADFDIELIALRRLVYSLRLAREVRVATLLTTSANWAASNRVTATAKWNGGSTATPLGDLFSALADSQLPATNLILSENVSQYFFANANSTLVRDFVQAGGRLPDPIIAKAKYFSGGSPAYVWAPATPANAALVRAGDALPSCMTLRWLGSKEGDEMCEGMLVRRFFEPRDDAHWVVVAHSDIEVLVSNVVGAVITGVLQ